ncbi:small membrane protein YoaI [Enterobacter ludwigii]
MYDHMFVETLIISSSFFAVAIILVASVVFLEKKG